MKVFSQIPPLRDLRWEEPLKTWGLVPTMGFLHEAHLSLVRRSRAENDATGVSIFVNPSQFNNPEDLAGYPRDLDRDLALLAAEGVDLVWTPAPETVYPAGYQTDVTVRHLSGILEGASRPGHFQGVATIVTKLFHVFEPRRAYFGQKDAQQLAVIRRLVRDLNFPIDIIACPTLRETDGLAMSSRNVRLTPAHRRQAVCLYQALSTAEKALAGGEDRADRLKALMTGIIGKAPDAKIDYVSVADADTLEEVEWAQESVLLSLAVRFGQVRLIDNVRVDATPE
jgi:pantoate--beta-alanine ligase